MSALPPLVRVQAITACPLALTATTGLVTVVLEDLGYQVEVVGDANGAIPILQSARGIDLPGLELVLLDRIQTAVLASVLPAQARLQAIVANQPVLVQISAAKRLRDESEKRARDAGDATVEADHVNKAGRELGLGEPA